MIDQSDLEVRLGRVLGIGSRISMLLFAAGLAALFSGAAGQRWAAGLINAGLLILLATPFTRVVLSTIAYAQQREWRFVIMTGIVLVVLLSGAFVATK